MQPLLTSNQTWARWGSTAVHEARSYSEYDLNRVNIRILLYKRAQWLHSASVVSVSHIGASFTWYNQCFLLTKKKKKKNSNMRWNTRHLKKQIKLAASCCRGRLETEENSPRQGNLPTGDTIDVKNVWLKKKTKTRLNAELSSRSL